MLYVGEIEFRESSAEGKCMLQVGWVGVPVGKRKSENYHQY